VAWAWCAFIVAHAVATVLVCAVATSCVFAPFFEVALASDDPAFVYVASLAYVMAVAALSAWASRRVKRPKED
jgi:protein-S-isoprenylcysteine O-methyltransferase Ste14